MLSLLVAFSFVNAAFAAVYTDPSDLPAGKSYDFIVVGGDEYQSMSTHLY